MDCFWILPRLRSVFEARGLARAEDWFSARGERLGKSTLAGWRERVMLELEVGGSTCRVYVKRFVQPSWGAQIKRMLSGQVFRSSAGVERHWITRMADAGLPVPEVVAFAEEGHGLWERRSLIALAEVEGESMERYFARSTSPLQRDVLNESARLIGRLHAAGFIHRDLYASHVFMREVGAMPRFCLIDLQRVMHRPLRWRRWQVRDLAQLNYSTPAEAVSMRARLMWLGRYVREAEPGVRVQRGRLRSLVGWIDRKTRRIAAHDARLRVRATGASC